MRRFQKDKGSILGVCMLTATFCGGVLRGLPAYLACGSLTLLTVLLFCRDRRRFASILGGLLCVLFSFVHAHFLLARPAQTANAWVGEHREVTATVTEGDGSFACVAELHTVDGVPLSLSVQLTDSRRQFVRGEMFRGRVTLSLPPAEEDGFPLRQYLFSRGVFLVGSTEEPLTYLGQASTPLRDRLDAVRGECKGTLRAMLGEESGLGIGLLFGERSALPALAERDLRRSGTSHLLAVSGLHLSILLFASARLCCRLRIRKQGLCVIQLLLAAAFAFFVGGSPSILRAAAMTTVATLLLCLNRRCEPIPTLLMSAAFLAAVRPLAVLDPGFLLSVSCVFGILAFALPVERLLRRKWGKRALGRGCIKLLFPFLAGWGALFGSLPVLAYIFGELSWVAPLAGCVLIPPAALALLLLFPALVLVEMGLPMAVGLPCKLLLRLLQRAAAVFSALPNPMLSLRGKMLPLLLLVTAGCLLCIFLFTRRRSLFACGTAALALCVLFTANGIFLRQREPLCTVTYWEQADEEVLLFATGRQLFLADLSADTASLPKAAARYAAEAYRAWDIGTYLVTRYGAETDHLLLCFCQEHCVREVLLPSPANALEQIEADRLVQTLPACNTEVQFYQYGDPLLTDSCRAIVACRSGIGETVPTTALWICCNDLQTLYLGRSSDRYSPTAQLIRQKISGCHILVTGQGYTNEYGGVFAYTAKAAYLLQASDSRDGEKLAPYAAPVRTEGMSEVTLPRYRTQKAA